MGSGVLIKYEWRMHALFFFSFGQTRFDLGGCHDSETNPILHGRNGRR